MGSGGRCEPPSGVRGGAPEDFEINAFQRLRTPVLASAPLHTQDTEIGLGALV